MDWRGLLEHMCTSVIYFDNYSSPSRLLLYSCLVYLVKDQTGVILSIQQQGGDKEPLFLHEMATPTKLAALHGPTDV